MPASHTGDNVEILSGGTLGGTIGGAAQIQLTQFTGFNGDLTTPIYMGAGNGASGNGIAFPLPPPPILVAGPQTSVQVPTPGGIAFNLYVAIAPGNTGNSGTGYTFIVCNEADCDINTNPWCEIDNDMGAAETTCQSNNQPGSAPSLDFLPGDTMSIQAYNSGAPNSNTVDVRWSMDFAITPPNAY